MAMTQGTFMNLLLLRGVLLGAVLAASPALQAQYKVVGPDGRVTYTDRPAPSAQAQPLRLGNSDGPAPVDTLPFELRAPAARFPVTLYTTTACNPCDQARSYLRQRGIPLREKTITSPADTKAWEPLGLGSELPVVRIGQQVHRGFQQSVWATDLDLAGYPAISRLPAGYRAWEATPLAGVPLPETPAPPPAPTDRPRIETPPAPPPTDPAPPGFRF